MLEISSISPHILNYSRDSRKTDLTELGQIGYLKPLLQIHQSSTLDKKYSMVIFKD
jgi:hypothetical protein